MSKKRRGRASQYTDAFKRQLVAESNISGTTVPMVSKQHGVPTSRIYSWRGDVRFQPSDIETPGFTPVEVADAPVVEDVAPTRSDARIEIALGHPTGVGFPEAPNQTRTRFALTQSKAMWTRSIACFTPGCSNGGSVASTGSTYHLNCLVLDVERSRQSGGTLVPTMFRLRAKSARSTAESEILWLTWTLENDRVLTMIQSSQESKLIKNLVFFLSIMF